MAEGEPAAPTEPSGWGSRGRVDRATPKEADAGGRAGAGNRGTGHSLRSVKKVGGPSGCQSGKPSPVLSRKSVCGRRLGGAPAMVAEEGEVAAFSRRPRSPNLPVSLGERGDVGDCLGEGANGPGWGSWGALGVARGGGARTLGC